MEVCAENVSVSVELEVGRGGGLVDVDASVVEVKEAAGGGVGGRASDDSDEADVVDEGVETLESKGASSDGGGNDFVSVLKLPAGPPKPHLTFDSPNDEASSTHLMREASSGPKWEP